MSDTITNYRLNKRIRLTIACLYLNSYFAANDRGVIAKAREVLDQHNIQLDVFPEYGLKTSWNTLSYDKSVKDEPEAYKELYKAAKEKIKQMGCTYIIPLPVIFGQYESGGYAIAPKVPGELTRLCMISPTGNADKMDLLHELGHAAELHHDTTDGSPRNFMHVANPRSVMYKYQVEALGKAPFSVG